MKKEVEEQYVLKNGKLIELTKIFRKVSNIEMDFDKLDEMMQIIDDSILIETSVKVYSKLEEKLREDAKKNLEGASQEKAFEVEQDFIKKINALSEKESVLERPLKKISQDIAKKAKLTLAEIRTLKEVELF